MGFMQICHTAVNGNGSRYTVDLMNGLFIMHGNVLDQPLTIDIQQNFNGSSMGVTKDGRKP